MAGLFRGVFVAGTALAKAVAFAVHLENVDVVGETVGAKVYHGSGGVISLRAA